MVSKDSEGYPEQLCATEEISELACPNLYLNREINCKEELKKIRKRFYDWMKDPSAFSE